MPLCLVSLAPASKKLTVNRSAMEAGKAGRPVSSSPLPRTGSMVTAGGLATGISITDSFTAVYADPTVKKSGSMVGGKPWMASLAHFDVPCRDHHLSSQR